MAAGPKSQGRSGDSATCSDADAVIWTTAGVMAFATSAKLLPGGWIRCAVGEDPSTPLGSRQGRKQAASVRPTMNAARRTATPAIAPGLYRHRPRHHTLF